MTSTRNNIVVVGIDGSESAHQAARWAAAEAELRNAELTVVHGFSVQPPMMAGMLVLPPAGFADFEESAAAVLDTEIEVLRGEYPDLSITGTLQNGSAFGSLLAASQHALLTVVGSDGLGAFAKRILGSVSLRMAGHAESPVVVVRSGPDTGAMSEPGSPVVVGVDGSTDSDDALVFAFEEASLRGAALVAVRVWDDIELSGFGQASALPLDREVLENQERRMLAEQLVGWSEKYPDVQVKQILLCGRTGLRQCCCESAWNTSPSTSRPSWWSVVVGTAGSPGSSWVRSARP